MDTTDFIEELKRHPRPNTITALLDLARWIERHAPFTPADASDGALRQRLYDELSHANQAAPGDDQKAQKRFLWHMVLLNAFMAPGPQASSWHIYARQLLFDDRSNSMELGVAKIAYGWAGDRLHELRATIALCDSLDVAEYVAEAVQIGEHAISTLLDGTPAVERAVIHLNVAVLYGNKPTSDHIQAAQRYAQTALRIAETALAEEDEYAERHHLRFCNIQAEAYLLLGRVAEEGQNNYAEAERYFACARDVLTLAPDTLDNQWFHLYLNQALLAMRLGQHARATWAFAQVNEYAGDEREQRGVLLYQALQAIQLGDRNTTQELLDAFNAIDAGPVAARFTDIQNARAAWYAAMLATTPEAGQDLEQAAATFEQHGLPLEAALTRLEHGRLLLQSGQLEPGKERMRQAARLLEEHLPERATEADLYFCLYDPDSRSERLLAALKNAASLGDSSTEAALATVLGRRAEQAKAEQALDYYQRAIEAIGRTRMRIRVPENMVMFLAARRTPFERAFQLWLKHDKAAALRVSDQLRLQSMADEQFYHQGAQSLLKRNPQLTELHNRRIELDYRGSRMRLLQPSESRAAAPVRDPEIERLEREYRTSLAAAHAADEAAWVDPAPLDSAEIQRYLGPDAALVMYQRVAGKDGEALWALVVTATAIEPVLVQPEGDYEDAITGWREQAALLRPDDENMLSPFVAAMAALDDLYDRFLAPLESQLEGVSTLTFVLDLDDDTPFLPLHAAWHPKRGHLIERYAVAYSPSAWALLECARRERQRRDLGQLGRERILAGWSTTLPYVREELRGLEPIVGVNSQINTCAKDALLAQLPDADIAHLATHGVFREGEHPRFARLDWNEAAVTAHDLYSVPLKASLLTLSACDLGQHGTGMQGMVSAALVSGASTVIASLWKVHDSYAPTFMGAVYAALFGAGKSRGEALRVAQRAAIDAKKHPADWAPFYLTGVSTHLPSRP